MDTIPGTATQTPESHRFSMGDFLNYQATAGRKNAPPATPTQNTDTDEAAPQANPQITNQSTDWDSFLGGNTQTQTQEASADNPFDQYPEPTKEAVIQARFVVKIEDMVASKGLQALAGDETSKTWRAAEDEIEDLQHLWAIYLTEVGGVMPVWLMLLLVVMVTYGIKVPDAIKKGRKKKQSKEQAQKNQEKDQNNSKNASTEEDIVDYTTSDFVEMTDGTQTEAKEYLKDFNNTVRQNGLEELAQIKPCPLGSCVYHWYIKGEDEPTSYGNFKDQSFSGPWSHYKRQCNNLGLDTAPLKLPK